MIESFSSGSGLKTVWSTEEGNLRHSPYGTYTASMRGGTIPFAFSIAYGWFVILGPMVHFGNTLSWTSRNGATQVIRINLPFPASSIDADARYIVSFGSNAVNIGGNTQLYGEIIPGDTDFLLISMNILSSSTSNVLASQLDNTGFAIVQGFYRRA